MVQAGALPDYFFAQIYTLVTIERQGTSASLLQSLSPCSSKLLF